MLEVIKRDGDKTVFDRSKITIAIEKAMNSSSGVYEIGQADKIAWEIEQEARQQEKPLTIYEIEDKVYYKLIENHNPATARAYENYKAVQALSLIHI